MTADPDTLSLASAAAFADWKEAQRTLTSAKAIVAAEAYDYVTALDRGGDALFELMTLRRGLRRMAAAEAGVAAKREALDQARDAVKAARS